jgi:hypothetical protein
MSRGFAGRCALIVAALLSGGASPWQKYLPVAFADPEVPRNVAAPPAADRHRFTAAPVPDIDLEPGKQSSEPARVELLPNLFRERQTAGWGDGYTPNSTVEGEQNKRIRPTPGLNLSVPLQ